MCSQSVKWLTAGLCCPPRTANFLVPLSSAADGKLSSVFAVRRMMSSTRHYMAGSLPSAADGKVQVLCRLLLMAKSLPSATVGKLTKWVSSQEAQLDATCLLCHPRLTGKSPLPSVADGKEPALPLFSVFSYTQPFSQQIDDTYIFFTWQVHSKHMRYPTHIYTTSIHITIISNTQVSAYIHT